MPICPKCGGETIEGKRFCPFCGEVCEPKTSNSKEKAAAGIPGAKSCISIQNSVVVGGVNAKVEGPGATKDNGTGVNVKNGVVTGGIHIQQVVETVHCAISGASISARDAFRCKRCMRTVSQQYQDSVSLLCTQCAEVDSKESVKLFIVSGPGEGKESLVTKKVTIGRDKANDIVLDCDNEISRRHVEISRKKGKWYIKDLGSSYGTFVNGAKVDSSEIKEGDLIKLGGTTLGFGTSGCVEMTMAPGKAQRRALINITKGERSGNKFPLDPSKKREFTIGRQEDNDICIGKSDRAASRHHAKIVAELSGFSLIDSSKNGTFISGKRLIKGEKVMLKSGDTIVMGDTELRFSW